MTVRPGSDYGVTTANVAFLLGPVIVAGTQIESGSAVAPSAQQGQLDWIVQLEHLAAKEKP
jgi:hypothetical protein